MTALSLSPCLRRILQGGVLLAGLAVVEPARAAAPVHVVLQLPYTPQFQFAGVYAAQAQGIFARHGLDVEIRPTNREWRGAIAEVLAGHAEFGVSQGPQILAGRLEGQPLVALAAIMQHSPQVLVSRLEDEIHTPHDLVGRRVALDSTSLVSEVKLMLEREGVPITRVTLVPNVWDVNELRERTADAMSTFVIDGPYDLERDGIRVNIMRPVDYGVDFYGDSLFTTEQVIRDRRPVVDAMRRAVLEGWDYALHHPDEMADWIADHCPDRPALRDRAALRAEAVQVARLVNADLVDLGHMNPGRWEALARELKREHPELTLARLDGFLLAEPESGAERFARLSRWLVGGIVVALVILVTALLVIRRLQRLVERRSQELRESERTQWDIFDHAPAPIVVEDYTAYVPRFAALRAQGVTDLRAYLRARPGELPEWHSLKRVRAANRLALTRTGYQSVADMDRNLGDVMTPQALDMLVEELGAIWDGVHRLKLEKVYHTRLGETIHTLYNWEVGTKDGQPDLANVRLAFTEISELKKAEAALRASEARYRVLFEESPQAIIEYDYAALAAWFAELRAAGVTDLGQYLADDRARRLETLRRFAVRDINRAAIELLGGESREQLFGRIQDIYTDEVIAVRVDNVVRMWGGADRFEGEFNLTRLGGSLRRIWYRWHLFHAAEGGPRSGRVLNVLVDITEQRRAETALRESETRYRQLFEHAVGGVYRSAPDGQFLSVNPAMARMFGFETPDAMLDWSRRHTVVPLYVQVGRRDEFLHQVRAVDRITDFESEVRRRDGSTFWIAENVRAVRNEAGQIEQYEGFVTDITARRRLESEMARSSKLEAVGILAGGIAHDFNNILTVVLGNVTLAEMDAAAQPGLRHMLNEAKRAALRARDLTQQLLTFAKGGDPVRAAVDLPRVIEEYASFALHGAKARGEFRIAPDLWPANADKGQIGQVLQNLVINSVQAMPEGGVVTIAADNAALAGPDERVPLPAGRYVRLAVTDTGVGIAADHLPKIFDPYFTTKQQGSGLGLATVYSIVRKHQGHIEVESQLGRGTTFRLWLPAATGSESAAPFTPAAPAALRARVLFMDDERAIGDMARLFMQRLGVECDLTFDGAEAVARYQEARGAGRPYDLVIMDLTVPGGMGGREAMERLQQIDPDVCAIVSSGYSSDPVLARYQAHGFAGILKKPYGLDQLRDTLHATLAARRAAGSR